METKFTAGTWHTNEGQIYPTETGKTLALIPYFDKDNEEQQANAKLIASAPEMFEALRKIATELKEGNYKGNHVNGMVQTIEQLIYNIQN